LQFIVFQQGEDVYLSIVRWAYFERNASPTRPSKLLEILVQILMKAFSMGILLLACHYCLDCFIIWLFLQKMRALQHLCLQKTEISVVKTTVLKKFRLGEFW